MGLRNVIFVNENHTRYRGWLARQVCYILFVTERDVAENKINLLTKVFRRVQKAFSDSAIGSGSKGKAAEREKRNAKIILSRMVATVSPFLLRLTGWVLLKLFNSFFSIVLVHNGQLNIVKQAANEANVPLIFLPIHKSHIDYLLITFILFCHNLQAPFIASGDNLNLPIIGFLIQRLGGFFIKRRLQEENGHKDVLYKSLLNAYIEQLFHEHQSMEIFLEGTRSRSGMPGLAKAGLLSILVDSLYSGIANDALIVPVGIAYDRILEGNFSREQLGQPKKSESLFGIFRGVLRMLRKNYGSVRVDFAQPFSIKVWKSFKWSFKSVNLSSAVQSSAIMSTNAVACLLLYKHRKGVLLPVLLDDFQWLKEQVLVRGFDVGFSGRPEDVVMHALHLLGEALTVNSSVPLVTSPRIQAPPGVVMIIPSTRVPLVFDLSYYSNGLLPVFACEAVVGRPTHIFVVFVQNHLYWINSIPLLRCQGLPRQLPYNLEFLIFLQNLLGPIIEAYSSVAIFLQNFSSQLEAESATYSLVKNAITTFLDMGVRICLISTSLVMDFNQLV
uniref:Glycerol-3-phosphate acyltransferase, mitochondrial n=1 Tax=Eptatretus burgeri TaxID=7764 RepID=A0A8C4WUD3_EPTBU